ncbi:hypothetical protein KVV02_008074 [Mortierella alpina]|uniref:OPT oligopeptide transporter protein-domain-containing protein n=1 Tax=Mortierella alpina TaxID=64518 RepID=A0A9P8CUH7_MORAP|nr:hypothetical protein KVV02_008074 [Mortierella alpina]
MSEQKQEYPGEKEFVDEKFDVEHSSVVLEEEENSPIPEVAAIVSNKDDPSLPVMTFRYYVMAVVFSLILSFFNQFFWFRTHPMTISTLVIQLLSYPFGKFMARVLPAGRLNPGPFSIKEHVLVALTANCAGGTAYAVDITVIQKVFYNEDFGFLANFLLILTTQMLGYGMAGVLRRYLVYPAAMIWPANLKVYPNSFLDYVHIPVLLAATGMMPPAQAYHYTNWLAVGFLFQFFARRYHPDWHLRFTYILSAAFDAGTAFMVLLSFFLFTMRDASMVDWWGTRDDLCPLEGEPYYAVPTAEGA